MHDVLDAVYQYPGGILADRLGRRRALMLFNLLAILGYVLYFFSRHWFWFLVGTLFVAAWSSMSLPATFAVIGDSLAQSRRAIGFSVQSILKRAPIVVAPAVGGWLLLISLTFTFFTLFPLVFALYPLFAGGQVAPFLILAFVVAGHARLANRRAKA